MSGGAEHAGILTTRCYDGYGTRSFHPENEQAVIIAEMSGGSQKNISAKFLTFILKMGTFPASDNCMIPNSFHPFAIANLKTFTPRLKYGKD